MVVAVKHGIVLRLQHCNIIYDGRYREISQYSNANSSVRRPILWILTRHDHARTFARTQLWSDARAMLSIAMPCLLEHMYICMTQRYGSCINASNTYIEVIDAFNAYLLLL